MTTYIAQYRAQHRIIQIEEHSCFTWRQESGEIDIELLSGKIKRESSTHFFKLISGENYPIEPEDILVEIVHAQPF